MLIKTLPYYVEYNFQHSGKNVSFRTADIKVLKEILPENSSLNIGDKVSIFNEELTVRDISIYNIYDSVKDHDMGENLKSSNLEGDIRKSLVSISVILE